MEARESLPTWYLDIYGVGNIAKRQRNRKMLDDRLPGQNDVGVREPELRVLDAPVRR